MADGLILGGTRNLGHVTALALLEAGHRAAAAYRGLRKTLALEWTGAVGLRAAPERTGVCHCHAPVVGSLMDHKMHRFDDRFITIMCGTFPPARTSDLPRTQGSIPALLATPFFGQGAHERLLNCDRWVTRRFRLPG